MCDIPLDDFRLSDSLSTPTAERYRASGML